MLKTQKYKKHKKCKKHKKWSLDFAQALVSFFVPTAIAQSFFKIEKLREPQSCH